MRLGTQTGSLMNHLYGRAVKGQPTPAIGMGATVLAWTDRRAATIIDVNGRIVTVQDDTATRIDGNGMSECQQYSFSENLYGAVTTFRQRKDGIWEEVRWNAETRRWNKVSGGGHGLRIGERCHYHDYSF